MKWCVWNIVLVLTAALTLATVLFTATAIDVNVQTVYMFIHMHSTAQYSTYIYARSIRMNARFYSSFVSVIVFVWTNKLNGWTQRGSDDSKQQTVAMAVAVAVAAAAAAAVATTAAKQQ